MKTDILDDVNYKMKVSEIINSLLGGKFSRLEFVNFHNNSVEQKHPIGNMISFH